MRSRIAAIILAAVTLLALCACSGDKDPAASSGDATQVYTGRERELADLLYKTEPYYAWFTGANAPAMDRESPRKVGEDIYYPVTESGFGTLLELRDFMRGYFTEDIVSSLMDMKVYGVVPVFTELDGRLYRYGSYTGTAPWDIGERKGHITEESDTSITYHVKLTYDYYATAVEYEFDYKLALGQDGVWRFSRYQLPAALLARELFDGGEDEGGNNE